MFFIGHFLPNRKFVSKSIVVIEAERGSRMKGQIMFLAVALAGSALVATSARAALVVGIVTNTQDAPVEGVRIRAVNVSGRTIGQAVSGADGHYAITQLPKGQYVFKLDPLATGVKPGDGVAYLSDKGLTLDWKVSLYAFALDDGAIGTSTPGALSGWTGAAAGALASGAVAGGTLGGLAAGGVLGGGSGSGPSGPAASPAI